MIRRRSSEYELGVIRGWYDSVPDDGSRSRDYGILREGSTKRPERSGDFQGGYLQGCVLRRGFIRKALLLEDSRKGVMSE